MKWKNTKIVVEPRPGTSQYITNRNRFFTKYDKNFLSFQKTEKEKQQLKMEHKAKNLIKQGNLLKKRIDKEEQASYDKLMFKI